MSSQYAQVIALLKKLLAHAEARDHVMVASVVLGARNNDCACAFAGHFGSISPMLPVLDALGASLRAHEQKQRAHEAPRLDASCARFNLLERSLDWDFVPFLICSEMARVRNKLPGPLRVFIKGTEKLSGAARPFLVNVLRPLIGLLPGAIEVFDGEAGLSPAVPISDICMAVRRGEQMPLLRAPDAARNEMRTWLRSISDQPPVVITLREAEHYGDGWAIKRNSSVEAWTKFARELQRKGENVIFVRDTAKANQPLEDFVTCPLASFYVPNRMALAELAKCNLYISNGPGELAKYSACPYLYMETLRPGSRYAPHAEGWWRDVAGMDVTKGDAQWPWAKPNQKTVWKPDEYKNLCAAWEELCPLL